VLLATCSSKGRYRTSPAAGIAGWIASASNHGRWSGAGFTSSAAIDNPGTLTAVGLLDDGQTVTPRATPYGDANLDGHVDADDAALMVLGRAQNRTESSAGNFNYDATLDADESVLSLRGAAACSNPQPTAAAPAAPPADRATYLLRSQGQNILP
jgi:hypothetical protein